MKKTGWLFAAVLAALLLAGCAREQEEPGYTIYYVNAAGTCLMDSRYVPKAETFEELMEELLEQMAQPPAGCESAFADGMAVIGYERGIDALRIDFPQSYYELGNTDEVLLRAAVVRTFSQIPGVAKVMLTVMGEQLHDAQGQPVPAMDADSFIDTREGGINSYLYAKLSLYFPDAQGRTLEEEQRSLHYSSNMVLERVIIEQLIEGPETSGLKPVFTGTVRIQNLYMKDGICTIIFDEEANKTPVESSVSPEAALYAVVNSICATCDEITGVRIEVQGDSSMKFRGSVDLNQTFVMNPEYMAGETEQEAESGAALTQETETLETEPGRAQTETETGSEEAGTEQVPATDGTVIGIDPALTSNETS